MRFHASDGILLLGINWYYFAKATKYTSSLRSFSEVLALRSSRRSEEVVEPAGLVTCESSQLVIKSQDGMLCSSRAFGPIREKWSSQAPAVGTVVLTVPWIQQFLALGPVER